VERSSPQQRLKLKGGGAPRKRSMYTFSPCLITHFDCEEKSPPGADKQRGMFTRARENFRNSPDNRSFRGV